MNYEDARDGHNSSAETMKRPRRSVRKRTPVFEGCPSCQNRREGYFCSLGSDILPQLEVISTPISAASSQQIFAQGQDPEQVFILCSGYVKLTASSPRGRKMIVRIAGPGSVLGLHAAVSSNPYEVTAQTLSEVRLRSVRRPDFNAFLGQHEEVRSRVTQCLCQDYRFVLQDACRVALTESVAARLGRLLVELAQQIGEYRDGEYRLPLLLTHEELANMTCTTRETITRTLGQFRKDGILSIAGPQLTLHKPEFLEALV
jgi:CRP/FNR family cyclic AMP-dependent transcriptional regulator